MTERECSAPLNPIMLAAGIGCIVAALILAYPYAIEFAARHWPGPASHAAPPQQPEMAPSPMTPTALPSAAEAEPAPTAEPRSTATAEGYVMTPELSSPTPAPTMTPLADSPAEERPNWSPHMPDVDGGWLHAVPTPTPTPIFVYPTSSYPKRLRIPAIDLDAPVEGVRPITERVWGQPVLGWDSPDYYAVGWHLASVPIGYPGNTVMNGHNNIRGAVFGRLHQLKTGDEIIVETEEGSHYYRVTEREIIREAGLSAEKRLENAGWIAPTDDERLTLITCWPPTGNSHRLVIIAHPYGPGPAQPPDYR